MQLISGARRFLSRFYRLEQQMLLLRESLGRIEARQLGGQRSGALSEAEFRVFSQFGEDGLIDHLTSVVPVGRLVFVEFGVENYEEANTRFLLTTRGWAGLIIDGSEQHIRHVQSQDYYWRCNLKALCAFVTRDNINTLLENAGISGEIGLLSVDIDGNDYWVWEAIDVVQPAIVVVEYNARFGPTRSVTVPYAADFVRGQAHHSMIYYGASLTALYRLGQRKGYALVGTNTAGNNAFFVRQDILPASVSALSPAEAYRPNQFREARNEAGELLLLDPARELTLLEGLPLVDIGD